jgi:hypothetical protein
MSTGWTSEKARAHRALHQALIHGDVPPKPRVCTECKKSSKRSLHAHHHKGYKPPNDIDVIWLCDSCHAKEECARRVAGGAAPVSNTGGRANAARIARMTPEQKAEQWAKRNTTWFARTTPEQRSEAARRGQMKVPPSQRIANASKAGKLGAAARWEKH